MSTPLSVSVERNDTAVIVSATGEIDIATAPEFRATALGAVARCPGLLVADLSGVSFIDSSGLNVLVLLRQEALSRGHELRLVTSRRIDAVLKIAGLDQVFAIQPDLPSALDDTA